MNKPAQTSAEIPDHDLALKKLMDGNRRYQTANQIYPRQTVTRRHALSDSQQPFALILGCADSRVPPELIFDQGLGDLFVIRVAGHVVDDTVLASVEFAVAVLGVPLIMVLGHSRCGAVEAAVSSDGLPGSLPRLAAAIRPAVAAAKELPGNLVDNTVKTNARMTAVQLLARSPLLKQASADEQVKIVAALYDLDSGAVELLT
ncbi:MAG: carbonic anhydrase [Chloroflexi bacterium]|nr:carbonic anhydrase [Chloroflexota bacterium]